MVLSDHGAESESGGQSPDDDVRSELSHVTVMGIRYQINACPVGTDSEEERDSVIAQSDSSEEVHDSDKQGGSASDSSSRTSLVGKTVTAMTAFAAEPTTSEKGDVEEGTSVIKVESEEENNHAEYFGDLKACPGNVLSHIALPSCPRRPPVPTSIVPEWTESNVTIPVHPHRLNEWMSWTQNWHADWWPSASTARIAENSRWVENAGSSAARSSSCPSVRSAVQPEAGWPSMEAGAQMRSAAEMGVGAKGGGIPRPESRPGEYTVYQAEMVRSALELLHLLAGPNVTGPDDLVSLYSQTVINLAKKGVRFLTTLQESKSFVKARQDAKSSLRARRHRGETALGPPEEFEGKVRQYGITRRKLLVDEGDLRMSLLN